MLIHPDQFADIASGKLKSPLDDSPWGREIVAFLGRWFDPHTDEIKVMSSGTTGEPHEWTHKKRFMIASAKMTCKALKLKKGSTALLCLPAEKISGMMMIVRAIVNQMSLLCIRPSTTPLKDLPDDIRIDFVAFTPMQLNSIMTDEKHFQKAQRISKAILGGEEVRPDLLRYVRRMFNETYSTYGMTETCSHIALMRLNGAKPENHFHTLPGVRCYSLEGDLWFEAPKIGCKVLHTKDAAEVISPTEFVWLGRNDHVINSGGYKLHPADIEKMFAEVIERPFFIAPNGDAQHGERPVIIIEGSQGGKEELQGINEVIDRLPRIKAPNHVWYFPEFVWTSKNGARKLNRKATIEKLVIKGILKPR